MTTAAALSTRGFFTRALTLPPKQRSCSVTCSVLPRRLSESRRMISFSILFLHFFPHSKEALSAGILDKYVKKKKLDPLESYIPAVLLTGLQIEQLGQNLDVDQPKFADCRTLLRSGPASSLRVNIRAVAQYASEAGNGKSAFNEVDQCLRALEELDSLLLRASRNDSDISIDAMRTQVVTALNAINGLLKTVPSEALEKGKAMVDAYTTPGYNSSQAGDLDPELKQLESLL